MPSPLSMLVSSALAGLGFAVAGPGLAQDVDAALAALQRPQLAVPVERGRPVDRLEWAQRLRSADSLGPRRQHPDSVAVLQAAQAGRWVEVKRLLPQPGVDVNTRDVAGANLLVLAAWHDQVDLLRLLLAQGAELDRTGDDGFTALGAAAFAGHQASVRLLLRAGADPQRLGASGQTALHLASLAGHTAVLQAFHRHGVSLELLNSQRESALDVAAANGQGEAMDWLLRHGADPLFAGRR